MVPSVVFVSVEQLLPDGRLRQAVIGGGTMAGGRRRPIERQRTQRGHGDARRLQVTSFPQDATGEDNQARRVRTIVDPAASRWQVPVQHDPLLDLYPLGHLRAEGLVTHERGGIVLVDQALEGGVVCGQARGPFDAGLQPPRRLGREARQGEIFLPVVIGASHLEKYRLSHHRSSSRTTIARLCRSVGPSFRNREEERLIPFLLGKGDSRRMGACSYP